MLIRRFLELSWYVSGYQATIRCITPHVPLLTGPKNTMVGPHNTMQTLPVYIDQLDIAGCHCITRCCWIFIPNPGFDHFLCVRGNWGQERGLRIPSRGPRDQTPGNTIGVSGTPGTSVHPLMSEVWPEALGQALGPEDLLGSQDPNRYSCLIFCPSASKWHG